MEIANTTQALERLDKDERSMFNIGRQGETNIINEPGLYSLVLGSRKPEAKEFKRWLTHIVIPSIRKTGSYTAKQMTPLEALGQTVQQLIAQDKRINAIEERLDSAVDNIHINDAQAFQLSTLVQTTARYWSQVESRDYGSVVRQIWKHVNSTCGAANYHSIRSVDIDKAMEAAKQWKPKSLTSL